MYDTLLDDVKGEIENKTLFNNNIQIKGWCFNESLGVCPVRCKYDGSIKPVDIITRSDICEKYKRNNIILCGWLFEVPQNKYCDIQIKINSEWKTFLSFNTFDYKDNQTDNNIIINNETNNETNNELLNKQINIDTFISDAIKEFIEKFPNVKISEPNIKILNITTNDTVLPSTIIVDNFYINPESIREIAKSSDISSSPIFQEFTLNIKTYLETLLNKSINNYDNNIVLTTSSDIIEVKTSNKNFCALIFLTPNAPINSGITIYRSKHTNKIMIDENDKSTVFQNGHQDITEFEPIDIISNIFNRLVIFNSKQLHSITRNFGNSPQNGRLVLEFYFDIN